LQQQDLRQWVKALCEEQHLWLNWYFTSENINGLLEAFGPYGINIKGSSEDKPGYKDFAALNNLVEALETE
jgi:phosphoribosylanthranilate isomerase